MKRRRLLVLGIDGGDLALFQRLGMKVVDLLESRGRIGHLQRRWREDRGWAMILCGSDASFTGGYYWAQVPGTYCFRQGFGANDYQAETLWTKLDRARLSTAFIAVPTTFPPQPIQNGIFVAGAGGGRYPKLEESVHPGSLLSSDGDLLEDAVLDVRNLVGSNLTPGSFIHALKRETQTKARMVSRLFDRHELDFAMTVFVGADRIQHLLWPHLQEALTLSRSDHYGILEYYDVLDNTLVELIERYSGDCNVVLCSDHGFSPRRFDVSVNQLLADLGFQRPRPGAAWSISARLESWFKDRVGERTRTLYRRLRPWRGYAPPRLDWEGTEAFVNTASGVWVNTSDRFPSGSVSPSARSKVVDRLLEALRQVRDPRTDELLFSSLAPREDAYEGPERGEAPDILFTFDDTYEVANDLDASVVRPFRPAPLYSGILPRSMSGIHGPGGIFGVVGPGVEGSRDPVSGPYTEVHEVILSLLDLADAPPLLAGHAA